MTADQILDRIIQANPRPAQAQVPGTVLTRSALLVELDRRSGDMQTQDKPAGQTTSPTKPTRPSRPRRLIPALAGAAAVVVALVIGVVALSSDQDPVSQYADAAAAGEPDAIFGLFMESYRTGDVEGALPYVDPDLYVDFTNVSDAITWMPGVIEFYGALYGRTEPGASVCEGPDESGWVSCTFTEDADGLLATAGFPELTYRGRLADGRIVSFEWALRVEDDGRISGGAVDTVEIPLAEYAAAIDPEGMAAQCDVARGLQTGELTSGFPLVFNQQCGAFLAGFVSDYQATLAGGADLQTAERFLALLESGDVAGYEALVDPEAVTLVGPFFGASSASWAYVSGFQAATHGTHTAECRATPTSPTIDVSCTIRDSNIFRETAGLNPESSGASFAIQDGTITLLNLGNDLIFPALDQIALYDGWLEANYPEERAGLMAVLDEGVEIRTWKLDISDTLLEAGGGFADGEVDPLHPMPVVETAAQRARHSELTTEWAATLP